VRQNKIPQCSAPTGPVNPVDSCIFVAVLYFSCPVFFFIFIFYCCVARVSYQYSCMVRTAGRYLRWTHARSMHSTSCVCVCCLASNGTNLYGMMMYGGYEATQTHCYNPVVPAYLMSCMPETTTLCCVYSFRLLMPLTSTRPHLRCDVGLEEGEYRENCLCLTVLCTIIMVHKDTSNCIGL